MQIVLFLLIGSILLGVVSRQKTYKTYLVLGLMIIMAVIGFLYLSEQFL